MSLTFKLEESPPQPSISVEDLNAELVKMRKAVNAAKVIVFRDMLRYLKRLREKLSKAESCDRLKNKLANRESEVVLLRKLSVDRLCKLLLANEKGKYELAMSGHKLTAQDRLITRLAQAKPVHSYVEQFREQHPDWRSLTHYMLYKNISGKWKSREQKKRNRKVRGALPLPPAPDSESLMDTTVSEDPISYRVPVVDSGESELPGSPVLPDPNMDIDSDAASDIADDLVQRILLKKGANSQTTGSKDGTPVSNDRSSDRLSVGVDAITPSKPALKLDPQRKKKKKKTEPKEVRFSLSTDESRIVAIPDRKPLSDAEPNTIQASSVKPVDDASAEQPLDGSVRKSKTKKSNKKLSSKVKPNSISMRSIKPVDDANVEQPAGGSDRKMKKKKSDNKLSSKVKPNSIPKRSIKPVDDANVEQPAGGSDRELKRKKSNKLAVKHGSTAAAVRLPVDLDEDTDVDDENPLGTDHLTMSHKMAVRTGGARRQPFARSPAPRSYGKRPLLARSKRPLSRPPVTSNPKPESLPKILHPSWQAKREQKLKAKLSAIDSSTVTSNAKHVVFDE